MAFNNDNPTIDDFAKLIQGKLKQIDVMTEQIDQIRGTFDAKEKKETEINGKPAIATISELGFVLIQFKEKEAGQEFFKSLK